MNPDKLFDYLDGKLSPADRDELENKLIDDPQLQRQFAIAREIHRTGKISREIMPDSDTAVAERGRRLASRVGAAAAVLVLVNVLGGLAAITYFNKRPTRNADAAQSNVRRQMEDALRGAGASALPMPSLSDDRISLAAPRAEWANLAAKITEAAQACDGSAVSSEATETSLIVTAHLPRERYAEFCQKVLGAGAASPQTAANGSGGLETVEIRIAESAR